MVRAAKTVGAAEAIGPLVPGIEVYVLTFGQFSLIDALHHLVEQAGPSDVDVSVWTAAHADLTRSAALLEQSSIRRMRWVVDRSFEARQPSFIARMRSMFGDSAIRVTASHCKFLAIRNERWNLAVRTSMNLNENPRLENLEVSDDAGLCGFLTGVVDSIFAEAPEGDFRAKMTALEGVEAVKPVGGVTCGELGRRLPYVSANSLRRT
jgi:hypothetical protein